MSSIFSRMYFRIVNASIKVFCRIYIIIYGHLLFEIITLQGWFFIPLGLVKYYKQHPRLLSKNDQSKVHIVCIKLINFYNDLTVYIHGLFVSHCSLLPLSVFSSLILSFFVYQTIVPEFKMLTSQFQARFNEF